MSANPHQRGDPLRQGFTLIEMMVVIAILALIAGSLVPVITRPYVAENQTEAMNEMAALEGAIYGKPEQGNYGWLGTIGALGGSYAPISMLTAARTSTTPPGLQNLLTQGSTPTAQLGSSANTPPDPGIVKGWDGPYLWPHYPQPVVDPWGDDYAVETKSGAPTFWRLRSNGPDRTPNTADDIVFPVDGTTYFASQGVLVVDVWKTNGAGMWPANTTDTSGWTATLSPNGTCTNSVANPNMFTCDAVYFGAHHLQILTSSSAVVVDQTVTVTAPYNYTRVFERVAGAALTMSGGSPPGLNTLCQTPSGGPVGDFCMGQSTSFGQTASGDALITYSGNVTISDLATECEILIEEDTGTGPVVVGKPVFVAKTNSSTPPPSFIVTAAVPLPLTGWKLYGVAAPVPGGTGSCTVGALATASNAVLLSHP